ncbi:hypothetical protein C8J57DRAFT_1308719 [Mycena rebaudengoi]|nr:hypothetical protein C8J57DRAFT_1308719 [Mycena rebaudengoi]
MIHFLSLLVTFSYLSAAQEVSPSTWRKPNITASTAERISLAGAALEKAVDMLSTTTQYRATVYSQMAEFDILTQRTTYRDGLQTYFSTSVPTLGDKLSIGRAAIRAYAAYNKDPVFLQFADEQWRFAKSYTISQADVSAGAIAVKNIKLQGACEGKTLAGGTFAIIDPSDTAVSSYETAYFVGLSALLAEATSDDVYLKTALDSVDFLYAHLISTQNMFENAISADSCEVDPQPNSFGAGLFLEGLAVLSSLTHNASTQSLLSDFISAAISNPSWNTPDGIIAEGASKLGDTYIVRGLGAAYNRNATTASMRNNVKGYLGVQFNAVVDLAKSSIGNTYAGSWKGPPSDTFSQANQTAALSPLLAAIPLGDDGVISTPASSSSVSSSSSSSVGIPIPSASGGLPSDDLIQPPRKVPIPAIVGGSLGGVALIASGILIWFILRRRARAQQVTFRASRFLETRPTSTRPVTKHDVAFGYPTSTGTASHGGTTSNVHSGVRTENLPSSEDLPTVDLVRLLNARLQGQQWDQEESPPRYATSPGGTI